MLHKAKVPQHTFDFDVLIIGSGPGGYESAIRASQLGMKTCIVEKDSVLGGVCLNWGCIPTKSLLKNAEVIHELKRATDYGISIKGFNIDFPKIIDRSRSVSSKMAKGVEFLMKKNKINVKKGFAVLTHSPNEVEIQTQNKKEKVTAWCIVIATGTKPKSLPAVTVDQKQIITSYEALSLKDRPNKIAIIGAGAIGVEFAYFYNSVGAKVTLIEYMKHILPNEDEEVSMALEKNFKSQGINILTNTKVEKAVPKKKNVHLEVSLSDKKKQAIEADIVLVAVGLSGNIEGIGLEQAGVKTENGFIKVDKYNRTNVSNIYAIGDVSGGPLLAHKASAEGIVAIEKIAGLNVAPIDYDEVPACTYCDPSVSHIGLTESQAKEKGYDIKIGKFPFKASGKATAIGHTEGFIKLVFDKKYDELLGAHIIGSGGTEIIAELCLARKMEATSKWIHKTIHAHPTLSEGVKEAAAASDGEAINI